MQESNNNLKEHPDLYRRSIKGGYWVLGVRFATQVLGFIKFYIVFNFLFNENLSLIFIANLFMATLTIFTESGFNAALIQKKEDIESYLDTAWVIGILRGILLFILIYFGAPLFASFKVDPDKASLAVSVIRVMSICFLIRAFRNIGVVYFQKELQFHKTFWLSMAGTITDILLSIILLLIFRNVWAVVVAKLFSTGVNLVMSYLMCSYRPHFHFVPGKARELWKFGKWLFGGNIITYLLNEGDDWFVLFFFLPDELPFKLYRSAYRFSNIQTTYIMDTISSVTFPAYSKIQDDLSRLREAYLKVQQTTSLISVPIAFLIFVLGPDFVKLFLVKESHAMASVIQVLAVVGLITSLGSAIGPILRALNRLRPVLFLQLTRLVLLVILIYPFTKTWGISGTASAVALVWILTYPPGLYIASRLIYCSVWRMLQPLLIPIIASINMTLVILLLESFFFSKINYIIFFALSLTGLAAYLISIFLLDTVFNCGLKKIVYNQLILFRKSTCTD